MSKVYYPYGRKDLAYDHLSGAEEVGPPPPPGSTTDSEGRTVVPSGYGSGSGGESSGGFDWSKLPWDKLIDTGTGLLDAFGRRMTGGGSKPTPQPPQPPQPPKPASDPNMPLYVLGGLAVLLVVLRSRK